MRNESGEELELEEEKERQRITKISKKERNSTATATNNSKDSTIDPVRLIFSLVTAVTVVFVLFGSFIRFPGKVVYDNKRSLSALDTHFVQHQHD